MKMKKNRAKRRSQSQRIGEKGESIFRVWATDNHLVPQKVDQDYGIDFFCQVMQPVSNYNEEATGVVLAVQVRSVIGKARPRVTVDRVDVESALRLNVPYCLVAIDVDDQKVYHLFLDEQLIRELHSLLESDSETGSLRLDRFTSSNEEFKSSLIKMCAPATQSRIRLVKTELKLSSDIPGANIKIWQSSDSDLALVSIPWITHAFQIDPDHRETVATMVFEEGRLPPSSVSGVKIRESFEYVKALVDGPIIFGGTFEEEVELFVRHKGQYKTASFLLRRVDDERAYVNESGLILVVSDARLNGGVFKHFMDLRITLTNALPLGNSSATLSFLKMLQPGAVINEVGRDGVAVESWPWLERVGRSVSAVEKVYHHLGLDLSDVFLADLTDEEFGKTVTVLELMIDGTGLESIMPGFVLWPTTGTSPRADLWNRAELWKRSGFRIPVIANLKHRGVEIWIEGTGYVCLYGQPKAIWGFRVSKQEKWEYRIKEIRFEKGINPEVIVHENWPAIPLFQGNHNETWSFKGEIQHALKGEVWPIPEE